MRLGGHSDQVQTHKIYKLEVYSYQNHLAFCIVNYYIAPTKRSSWLFSLCWRQFQSTIETRALRSLLMGSFVRFRKTLIRCFFTFRNRVRGMCWGLHFPKERERVRLCVWERERERERWNESSDMLKWGVRWTTKLGIERKNQRQL